MNRNADGYLLNADDILQLVATRTPESLHLEYKLKVEASSGSLSKDDSRAIAEAVTAFANSDGGTLVMGIRSEKHDSEDVACEIVELAGVARLAGETRNIVAFNVSPPVRGVIVRAVAMDKVGGGVLVVDVPASDGRPHMSTAPKVHRYYRRGFTGNLIMTPGEIRDQILALREAVLTSIVQAAEGGSLTTYPSFVAVEGSIHVKLRNDGVRLCREPFIRVAADCVLGSHSFSFDPRLGAWKTDYRSGTMIHVGDESQTMSLRFLARFDTAPLHQPDELTIERLISAVTILPFGDFHAESSFKCEGLQAITLDVTQGAENATARTDKFVLSREDIARSVLRGTSAALSAAYNQEVGCWRTDIFNQL